MEINKTQQNVVTAKIDVSGPDWEQWILVSSDRHHDSLYSDKALAKKHMEMVKSRNAKVIDIGDFFDAMQGKYDPRKNYTELDPRYLSIMNKDRIGYLDAIVKDAVEFYKPYSDLFLMIGKGNHETSILDHTDTDLTSKLVYGLNTAAGGNVQMGSYAGWVRFNFVINSTQKQSLNLKYIHGYGGGGVVTKGVIQSNRQAVYLPDADIVVNGHIHESWILSMKRERLSNKGITFQDYQHHVRTGTYKDDFNDGSESWAVRSGMPPKPKGAVWIRFHMRNRRVVPSIIQELDV